MPCLGLKRCFEFITRERLIPDSPSGVLEEEVLTRWLGQGESRYEGEDTVRETTQAHEDSVFMRSFIPRTLNEVYDPERDVEKLTKGQGGDLIYADTIGIVEPLSTLVLEGENEGVRSVEKTAKQKTVFGSTTPSPRMWSSIPSLGEDDPDQKDLVILTAETKSTEGEGGGGKEEEDESRSEEEEGVSEEGSDIGDVEHHKDGWVEKIPKGHRHEDREAKKVSYPTALYGRKGNERLISTLEFSYLHRFFMTIVFFHWLLSRDAPSFQLPERRFSLALFLLFYSIWSTLLKTIVNVGYCRREKRLSRRKPRNGARTKCPRLKRSVS